MHALHARVVSAIATPCHGMYRVPIISLAHLWYYQVRLVQTTVRLAARPRPKIDNVSTFDVATFFAWRPLLYHPSFESIGSIIKVLEQFDVLTSDISTGSHHRKPKHLIHRNRANLRLVTSYGVSIHTFNT